ncbi:Protein of unknown function [Micromonospora krabiensis]|uniref:DUF2530 domain-containing protein n=1 Tax=Micromonospora krabiensis TaxID=307121 RepID=A0A1C3N791_9ACTN|nr:Protein of unknown function [Micromonospora krabiensis]
MTRASSQISGQRGKLIAYACRVPKEQPRPEPLDPPMVPFALAGMAAWAVVGLVLLVFFRDWLTEHDHRNWLWICLAGFLWGFPGLAVMMRHDANRRRRRAAASR